MKKFDFLKDVELAASKEEISNLDTSRGGANGLPNFNSVVLPLIGKITFKITDRSTGKVTTHTPTGIGMGYIDKGGKFQIKMVSTNSFQRVGRIEAKDASTETPTVENAPNWDAKPSEIISEFGDKVLQVNGSGKLFFPQLSTGTPPNWDAATQRNVTYRSFVQDDTAAQIHAKFTEFCAENPDIADCVKAINPDYLTEIKES